MLSNRNDVFLKKEDNMILWKPDQKDPRVDKGLSAYLSFSHVSRTVHLEDGAKVFRDEGFTPLPVNYFSTLNPSKLPPGDPLTPLRVIWFSPKSASADEHDFYGNVRFELDMNSVIQMFPYFYLVEMKTAPTYTATRILLTKKKYNHNRLTPYDPFTWGGSWRMSSVGDKLEHWYLFDCQRFKDDACNIHGHKMEFMVEANEEEGRDMFQRCSYDFTNHTEARKGNFGCHKFTRRSMVCPYPYSKQESRRIFNEMALPAWC
ncbi:uncharacterized protein LOC143024773 isoform X2 [Oratosquilla oratoria]